MSDFNFQEGVWFVYDGDCPICTHAAEALRIKQQFGALHLVNARESSNNTLLSEINKRGLDLDEGMVIYTNGHFYHGKEALKFMAKHGEATNFFSASFKSLFWSDPLAQIMYPWMRGARNWLLQKKGAGRIDNLNLQNEPIFRSIFGEKWVDLPNVMKKHYANHPYSTEVISVEGKLNVFCRPPLIWLAPFMHLIKQIPIYNESNVPVTVLFKSDLNSKAFQFHRTFYFSKGKPYVFHSKVLQIDQNEVVEMMKFNIGWKMKYGWDGTKVTLEHKGYVFKLFGHLLPLPLTPILGIGYATEYPVDDNTFDMEMTITHPWWGKIYGYNGRFKVTN